MQTDTLEIEITRDNNIRICVVQQKEKRKEKAGVWNVRVIVPSRENLRGEKRRGVCSFKGILIRYLGHTRYIATRLWKLYNYRRPACVIYLPRNSLSRVYFSFPNKAINSSHHASIALHDFTVIVL